MVGDATEPLPVNRLSTQQSPYLLQHAHQPVAWWPWCPEAFQEARRRNVPVLISIGYATCHWCHVMAHESFDDPSTAAYLNQHYVSIKVDREERPDVDAFYMDVCQAMTGHGGWPLTVFADADRRPFFTGTYFPPQSRAGRIGFPDLLARINQAWTTQPDQVRTAAAEIVETMQAAARQSARGDMPADVFNRVADYHRSTFDDSFGGFRVQPKFPSPHHLLLLFRIGYRTGDTEMIRMATTTLDAMRAGGIYDHVGFGLHRYSTDREWLLPHFEKMLYDQAMVMLAYAEAWQLTGRQLYRQTCEEIADYLQREMTSPTGAFYSAQDADSEGVEGKYYVWSYNELASLLSADDLAWLCEHRGLSPEGNVHDEATGDATGTTILHLPKKHGDPHQALANDVALVDRWESIRKQLLPHRQHRVPPLTDDKILVDWNGLMIGALAVAGRTFQHLPFIEQAQRAYADVVRCCGGPTWVHRFRGGERAVDAMLDDHACIGWAAVELYHSTGDEAYLHDAEWHAQHLLERFVDRSEGGDGALMMVADGRSDVPVQYRQGYDGAYPSGNSMAAMLLVDLGRTMGQQQYLDAAHSVCTSYAQSMEKLSSGFCMLLCAWDAVLHDATEIVYVGDRDDPLLAEARHHFASQYRPGIVHLWADDRMSSAMRTTYAVDSAPRPSVLICRGGACQLPITTIEQIHAHQWPQEG